jgi:hypothetical protein
MTERALHFGADGHLLGTLCPARPGRRQPGTVGLILLNAGIVHRVGPHRFNVKLARHAAELGVPSLRFDMSGRGDSGIGRTAGGYREAAIRDIRDAVRTLAEHEKVDRFMLFGICSGAIDGYVAALEEPRIVSLVMFDPHVFPTIGTRTRDFLAKLRRYGIVQGIKRLQVLRHVRNSVENADDADAGSELPPIRQYAADLRRLTERGTRVHLVYSGSSCDQVEFEAQRRKLLSHGMDPRVRTELIPTVDHVITSLSAQREILSRFAGWSGAVEAAE